MKIPKTFKLFGAKWKVYCDEAECNTRNATGLCTYRRQEIAIMPKKSQYPFKRQHREQTFCHELIHAIAYSVGVELTEAQTDTMGLLLHQFMETQKGEIE